MTEAQLRDIWKKTNGHCHFCGDPVSLRKRGYRRQRADGCWEVDHVSQRARGGAALLDNCLPACTSCNRLRWHRSGAEIREILRIGLIAKRELEAFTATGKRLIVLTHRQMKLNQRRRTGSSLPSRKGTDPLLKAHARQTERDRLIHFLKKNRKRSFSAAQLKKDTNIPKSRVRSLLATSRKVSITRDGRRYIFQSRLPKRRRLF
jgi:hypothetical protein